VIMSDVAGAAAAALAGGDNSTQTAAQQTTGTTIEGAAATGEKWYSTAPPELQGLVEKKGWKDLPDALKSYAELEKHLGADKLPLPKDENDADGWGKVYDKLGRPKTAGDYKFPEGVDTAVVQRLAPELHKAGITQKQAEVLAKLDLARAQEAMTAEATRVKADDDAAMAKLQSEWGGKFNENLEVMRRAMRNLGMSVQDFSKAGAAIGHEKVMRLLNLAGVSAREDNSAGLGEGNLGFGMTPNRARAELAAKEAELLKRAHAGDKAAAAERDRLHRIAYPE